MLRRVICSSGYLGRLAVKQNDSSLVAKRNSATIAAAPSLQEEWEAAKPFEDIPGPKPLPIIGNLWRFLPYIRNIPTDMTDIQDHFYKQYGDIVKLTGIPGRNDVVMIFNPEDYEKVYRNLGPWPSRENLNTTLYYRKFARNDIFDGNAGALVTQGKEWYDFRRKVNPIMMKPRSAISYVQPADAVAADFIERIKTIRDDKLEMPSDFSNELSKWALESVFYIAIGTRLGCLSGNFKPDSEIQKMIDALYVAMESIFYLDMDFSPWSLISPSQWIKYIKSSNFFYEMCIKYINEAKERLKTLNNPDRELTLLEKLILGTSDPKVANAMVLDMMTAGVDTTATTTAIILYFLGTNPEKQEKAFQEIRSYIKEKDQPVTWDVLNELRYLKASIKEGMRLRTVAFATTRTLANDVVICGYRVPKGIDAVMVHPYICRLEKHFPQATQYIPERWLRSNEGNRSQAQETHPFVYMPFAHGPRSCLGKRFAELELETMLTKIIRNFRFEYNYGEMKFRTTTIYAPISPLKFKFADRE